MITEAPKLIASFACNQLHALGARAKVLWSYVREEREIFVAVNNNSN
jgi:hypothetical protein